MSLWKEQGAGRSLQRRAPQQWRHRPPELGCILVAAGLCTHGALSGFTRYLCLPVGQRIALQEAMGAAHPLLHSTAYPRLHFSLALSPFPCDSCSIPKVFNAKCARPDKHSTDKGSSWVSSGERPDRRKHVASAGIV